MRFSVLVWLRMLLTSQSGFAQFDSKQKIILSYSKAASADTVALKAAVENPVKAKTAAVALTKRTDDIFRILEDKNLLDQKLVAYQNDWSTLKFDLQKYPANTSVAHRAEVFRINFALASKARTCTVVVSASRGLGALVKYAKALDADQGQEFKELGPTVVTRELERAEYKFKSFREGNETGRTDPIPCIAVKTPVTVVIVEN
jgi:hypothetical protein